MSPYQPNFTLLQDRVVLVTGASSGIGRAVAKSYAAHGATVILLGRNVKALTAVYDEIEDKGGPRPAIYPLNLATATPEHFATLADAIEKEWGRLEGLLHNAALLGPLTPIEHYPINQWYEVIQVALNSRFLLTQAILPLLKRAEDASILFTASPLSTQGKAYWGAYAVAHFGSQGLMQILAHELEHSLSLRVNSLNPVAVKTDLRAKAYPAEDTALLPLPEDIVNAYLYFMGPDSKGMHGHCMEAIPHFIPPIKSL